MRQTIAQPIDWPFAGRTVRALLLLGACVSSGAAYAQGQVVDRGTADLGANSASQRVVEPGIAQFSPEGALTDRFGGQAGPRLANLYHEADVDRRYLYRAPGVTALYNQSDYLTRDAQGVGGINRNNAGNGAVYAIAPADIVYVLSPELLEPRAAREPLPPSPGQIDRQVSPTAVQPGPYGSTAGGMLNTRIDGHIDTAEPRIVDVAAIHQQRRGAQRDPRLVERSRRWQEERAAQAASEAEAAREAEGPAETVQENSPADSGEAEPGAVPETQASEDPASSE
ncbi:MAG: hypothetical protein ACIAXF_16855 [Phycisphaerales bacterium JB063]